MENNGGVFVAKEDDDLRKKGGLRLAAKRGEHVFAGEKGRELRRRGYQRGTSWSRKTKKRIAQKTVLEKRERRRMKREGETRRD